MAASVVISLLMLGATAYAVDMGTHKTYHERKETFNFTYVCSLTGYKVEGMTWSECRHGKSEPIGCAVASGEKLKFGEVYTDGNAQYRCDRDGDGIKLTPIACILDGNVLKLNRGAFSGRFYYRCSTRPGGGIGLDITGCKDERLNIAVPFNSTFRRGDFQFLCDTNGKKAYEVGVGCYVHQKGSAMKLVKLDDTYRIDDYYYKCSRKGKRGIKTEVIGCADEKGSFVDVGETLRGGFILYGCTEKANEGITIEPVGCVIKDQKTQQLVEYRFGDSFYESYKDGLSYKLKCMQQGEEIGPQIVECIASSEDNKRKKLKVGCGTEFEGKAFICKDMGEGRVMAKLRSISKGKTLADVLAENGVKEC